MGADSEDVGFPAAPWSPNLVGSSTKGTAMSKNRIAAGLAVAAFGVALSVGTAVAADLPGNGCSVPCPPTTGQVLPNAEVNAPAPQVEAVAATSPTARRPSWPSPVATSPV